MADVLEVLELLPPGERSLSPAGRTITRRAARDVTYDEFFWAYMHCNWPVILTGISDEWECYQKWLLRPEVDNGSAHAAIHFDYLRHKIGNCRVPVANCAKEYFNSHAKLEMPFHGFLDHWQSSVNANHGGTNPKTTDNLYLKDWHLQAKMPHYRFYRVPKHFASDWLNEKLLASGQDDYRFVYMGPKDSWTPFHVDVFGSFSWSTNIVGCKKWLLLPPGEESKLLDPLGNLPFSIDETQLRQKDVHYFTLYQGANEAVFVPSGWHHQVANVTDTISVNHNWFNGCNLGHIWRNVATNMRKVIAEIEDCRQMDNFDDHCQMMLRASFGLNYLDFLELLEFVTEQRVQGCHNGNIGTTSGPQPSTGPNPTLFDRFTLNEFHINYDLQAIQKVVQQMLNDDLVCNNRAVLYRRCLRLLDITNGNLC